MMPLDRDARRSTAAAVLPWTRCVDRVVVEVDAVRRGDPAVAAAEHRADRPVVEERHRHDAGEARRERARDDRPALADEVVAARDERGRVTVAQRRWRRGRRCRRRSCAAAARCPAAGVALVDLAQPLGRGDDLARIRRRDRGRRPELGDASRSSVIFMRNRRPSRENAIVAGELDRERRAGLGVEDDLAGQRLDRRGPRATAAARAARPRAWRGVGASLTSILRPARPATCGGAAIGQLGARRDAAPRSPRSRAKNWSRSAAGSSARLGRAPVPALVARPQVELAADEHHLAAVVGGVGVDARGTRLAVAELDQRSARRARSPRLPPSSTRSSSSIDDGVRAERGEHLAVAAAPARAPSSAGILRRALDVDRALGRACGATTRLPSSSSGTPCDRPHATTCHSARQTSAPRIIARVLSFLDGPGQSGYRDGAGASRPRTPGDVRRAPTRSPSCSGLLWGSFANVCIYRWPPTDEFPNGRSVVKPGSHCFACKTPIRWYDNVPLLSWLWLRGRCRACQAAVLAALPDRRGADRRAVRASRGGSTRRRPACCSSRSTSGCSGSRSTRRSAS